MYVILCSNGSINFAIRIHFRTWHYGNLKLIAKLIATLSAFVVNETNLTFAEKK